LRGGRGCEPLGIFHTPAEIYRGKLLLESRQIVAANLCADEDN
jgi:hypothetical protein